MTGNNSGAAKILGVTDILLMNVVAILSIRQIPNVAPYGASAIILWVLAAVGMFLPLALVCGELSTGWPEEGGIFVWVKEAFGTRVGWIIAFIYFVSLMVFFPLMMQFMLATIGYIFNPALADNKVFVGLGSIIMFWLLTLINVRGMEWTKKINNLGAIFGVFVPAGVLVLLAVYWLATGHPMSTDYATASNWIPNLKQWSTIVFLSSMMFAFAGMEVAPMVAGRCKNPQKDFPRAILFSAIIIVAIYIIGTIALNTIFPAEDANIVAGIMQGMQAASVQLGMPWLLPVMGILIAIGALGQINSWLIGPLYMITVASGENNILGSKISEIHPRYGSPAFALYAQAVIVTVLCLSTFISPSVEAAYWTLTALCTLIYFVPYMFLFIAFIVLRNKRSDVYRSFTVPGKLFPKIMAIIGFIAVTFAVILIFIPPDQIDMGSLLVYELQIAGGGLIATLVGDWLYRRSLKNKSHI